MGQYFMGVCLKPNWKEEIDPVKWAAKPHDFGNGAKMTEHAYVGNNYVAEVCRKLGGVYKGYPFVWVGDYAEHITTKRYPRMSVAIYKNGVHNELADKLRECVDEKTFSEMCKKSVLISYDEELFNELKDSWDFHVDGELNVYGAGMHFIESHRDEVKNPSKGKSIFKYILNYDKKEYVKIPRFNFKRWTYHPLPLLCAAGNGQGSGDFDDEDLEDYVGIWAYDRIGLDNDIPNNFTELKVNFGYNK